MELRIRQNQVGQFNLCSNEKTLSFSMGIYENGKPVEKDGLHAVLHYSGEPEEQEDFKDAIGNIDFVFPKCYEYSQRVWGSTNYRGNCVFFLKTYIENYEVLNDTYVKEKRKAIEEEIERLQKKLKYLSGLQEATDFAEPPIKKELAKYKKWLASETEARNQTVEGTPLWDDKNKRCLIYEETIQKLEDVLEMINQELTKE